MIQRYSLENIVKYACCTNNNYETVAYKSICKRCEILI